MVKSHFGFVVHMENVVFGYEKFQYMNEKTYIVVHEYEYVILSSRINIFSAFNS